MKTSSTQGVCYGKKGREGAVEKEEQKKTTVYIELFINRLKEKKKRVS